MPRWSLIALVAACVLAPGCARAEGSYWPWCLDYRDGSYNCGFASFEQCIETALRVRGFCRQNPLGPPAPPPKPRRPAR
jgi:hypothetical protein